MKKQSDKVQTGIRPEYRKYSSIKMPTHPAVLAAANRMMPVIQKENSIWKDKVCVKEIPFAGFSAQLIAPKTQRSQACLIYFHGGAFSMKAARYHKNLVRRYACDANLTVLFADYRLAPKYQYPIPLNDCFEAYRWALKKYEKQPIYVGGDSAGGNLGAAVVLRAIQEEIRLPDKLMLIYPVTDSRMKTSSMENYTDTPLWNARQNRRMWDLYASYDRRHEMFASPAETEDFYLSQFPESYIETAEYDCLRDEGIAFAKRLERCGVPVKLHNTKGTIHGYEIEEKSPYVKKIIAKRIDFLKRM